VFEVGHHASRDQGQHQRIVFRFGRGPWRDILSPEEFDFEISRVVNTIRQRECKSALLLFPEGLKRKAADVSSRITSQISSCRIIVSGEPCFGACEMPRTDADLIVHFGHLPIPSIKTEKSVLYIQARSSADPLPAVESALPHLPDKVGIVTIAQHIHTLQDIVGFLETNGKTPHVGKGDNRTFTPGQVLGCNTSSAKSIAEEVNAFLFVGTGNFHPLAVALSTGKSVIVADPVTREVRTVEELKDKVLKQRFGAIELAKHAKSFGIILSTKVGQRRKRVAYDVEQTLREYGKRPVIVEMDLVIPERLDAFRFDSWVSTACPRLAIDDIAAFSKPVLTPFELEIALGIRKWDEYRFDEIA
jgi:2-(3-amino-3-carboxypropyl)histidine synthase